MSATSTTATTRLSRDDVWAALHRPESWEGVAGSETATGVYEGTNLVGLKVTFKVLGQPEEGAWRITESTRPEHMQIQIAANDAAGVLDVRLRETEGGTEMTAQLALQPRSMRARLGWGGVWGAVEKGFSEEVDRMLEKASSTAPQASEPSRTVPPNVR